MVHAVTVTHRTAVAKIDIVNIDQCQSSVIVNVMCPDSSRTDINGNDGWLTAVQVSEALGIKRATVYAYVSRGLLHRRLAMDGRTSLFERSQVEELRSGRRREAAGELRTVLATAITSLSEGSLVIRGRNLVQAVEAGSGFEVIADAIWQADNGRYWNTPPEPGPGNRGDAGIPGLGGGQGRSLPVLDRFRIAVALAAAADPMRRDLSPTVVRRTGPRLIRAMIESLPPLPEAIPAPDHNVRNMPMARLLWPRLTAIAADDRSLQALDTAMALLSDHGLATSTFAVRVAASVRADPYAAVGAGLGALDGPFHGSASGAVHQVLVATADGADVMTDLGQRPAAAGGLPGFGHTVYRTQDPRFASLRKAVVSAWPGDERHVIFDNYVNLASARTDAVANVDLALGYLTWMGEMTTEAGEAIFAVARCAGWLGHVMEEYEERPLRLRPKGHYVGPLPVPGQD